MTDHFPDNQSEQEPITLLTDPKVLETPSHVFVAHESALDRQLVHASVVAAESSSDVRRPRMSEGEALGGLALLAMYGLDKLISVRIALKREERIRQHADRTVLGTSSDTEQ